MAQGATAISATGYFGEYETEERKKSRRCERSSCRHWGSYRSNCSQGLIGPLISLQGTRSRWPGPKLLNQYNYDVMALTRRYLWAERQRGCNVNMA